MSVQRKKSIKNRINDKLINIFNRIRYIFENTSLHGLRHLVQKRINKLLWLFWITVILLSVYGMQSNLRSAISSLEGNAISFTPLTTYLGWNTTFPAVTVCEIYNSEKVWDISNEVFGVMSNLFDEQKTNLNEFLSEIAFFSGTCTTCSTTCQDNLKCPKDFSLIVERFRAKCEELLIECSWNGVPFDCCAQFLPVESEFGVCFSINSLHTISQNDTVKKMNLTSNQQLGIGFLQITATEDYEAFVHPPEDVPFVNGDFDMKTTVLLKSKTSMTFSIVEVTNDPSVKNSGIEMRQCRFSDEKPENLYAYDIYSYSTCVVQCRVDADIALCNCTHHFMPSIYKDQFCDIFGLACLTDYYSYLSSLKHSKGTDGLDCDCLPNCEEPEYALVELYKHDLDHEVNKSVAIFSLRSLPSLRYNRQIAKTGLDLLVAVGNAIGLFFGASILTLVELIYLIFLRKWDD